MKLCKVFKRNSREYYDPFLIKGKLEMDWPDSEQDIN